MKDMNDPVKDFCKSKGYDDFVIEGGLAWFVTNWEKRVARLAHDYSQMTRDDYLNDMDYRRYLHEVLQVATDVQCKQAEVRIKVADEIYFDHTVSTDKCIWGERNEKKYKYSPQVDWWYYREPKVKSKSWCERK